MKGRNHPTNDVVLNPSCQPTIHQVIDTIDPDRRAFMKASAGATALAALTGVSATAFTESASAAPIPASSNGFAGIGFESIPAATIPTGGTTVPDLVQVPPGYRSELFVAWGDPIMPGAPAWKEDGTETAAEQAMQFGENNDGMHFFPFPVAGGSGASNDRGLLCVNHEYTQEQFLHGAEGLTGGAGVTIAKVRKSQAAHGVAVVEARRTRGRWGVVRNSAFGRRVTVNTPMRIGGPAAGSDLVRTNLYAITDAGSAPVLNSDGSQRRTDGTQAWGTLNNCAHGYTPWGTYLTCEENWNAYFGTTSTTHARTKNEIRYGVQPAGAFGNYFWWRADDRFDIAKNPNEQNTFGYVVEIDPFNPRATPVKRTALGRFKHESVQVAIGPDYSVTFYMGCDERSEYIYKFVCAGKWNPKNRAANMNLMDSGTLYVAKFTATAGAKAGTYRGEWIALVPGTVGVDGVALRDNPNFAGGSDADVQGRICVLTRMAADAVGATPMDRPEWVALRTYSYGGRPSNGYTYGPGMPLEVYCTLTNSSQRGRTGGTQTVNPDGSRAAGDLRPPVDAANPRPDNDYGHIIRWRDDNNDAKSIGFEWDIFVLCGDTKAAMQMPNPKTLPSNYTAAGHDGYNGDVVDVPAGSADFGAPDGLWFDHFGRLWIQTDQAGDGRGDWQYIGANAMLCADPNTKEVRRFMTSPPDCEVTGMVSTPDGRTMWVGIQHPNDGGSTENPTAVGNWPQGQYPVNSAGEPVPNTAGKRRPRSAVVVVTRNDGGVIGGL
jgi:hypothetical protein